MRGETGEIIDFRWEYANDAACARNGLTREQMLGHRISEVLPGYTDTDVFKLHRRVAQTGEPARVDEVSWHGEWVAGRQVDRAYDGSVVPLGPNIIVTGRDVTAARRNERELRLQAELLDLAHDAVIVRDPVESGVTFWNREAETIYGYSRQEALGKVTHELLATVFPDCRESVDDALARKGQWVGELRHTRKHGTEIIISSRQALQRSKDGQPIAIIELNSDITERRKAQDEIRALNTDLEQRVADRTADLERVNRELETFAYAVSHDLRAPLRAVNAFSHALLEDYAEKLGDDGRHDLERVRAAGLRMGKLIDAVLELSRLSRRRLAREPVDLTAIASEIVAELRNDDPDRRVEVEIDDGLLADADPDLVQIVLANLLGNAFKFTAKTDDARIQLGSVKQDSVPVYFVADNGAGFEMAHAKRLFLPFHRLHRESEFLGEGIGLATAKRAVRKHSGEIWAEGALNQGATFHFTLTAGAHPPASAATGDDVVPSWQPAQGDNSHGQ